jgi:hypothetical protein
MTHFCRRALTAGTQYNITVIIEIVHERSGAEGKKPLIMA